MDSKELAVAIAKREQQIKKYVLFALELIKEIGEQIFYEQSSSNTEIKKLVSNFGGFEFLAHFGMTSMGGNEVTITIKRDWCNERDRMECIILKVYWQAAFFNVEECRVNCWSDDQLWQERLDKVIENKQKILADISRVRKIAEETRARAKEQAEADQALRQKAIRLGF